MSMRPFASTTRVRGRRRSREAGADVDLRPERLPAAVDFWSTTFKSPVAKPQLPSAAQMSVTVVRSGP